MRILSKKLIIAIMSVSMAVFPAVNANAQAGTIAGVATPVAVVGGIIVVGLAAYSIDNANDDSRNTLPITQSTATTATSTAGGSSSTTTTTN